MRHITTFIHLHEWSILLLLFVALLRAPNFVEPYWYGDETIYLTIGTALRSGEVLYKDIVDHKTPLIYMLSMVESQFALKALLFGWSLISVVVFMRLCASIGV